MSRTAMGAAWCRLVEQGQPSGLRQFNDPVVGSLLDPMLTMMASTTPMRDQLLGALGTGTYGAQVMRTRYIDDVVTGQVAQGVSQVVILGAGLDTRAYRMASLGGATVWEVDLPDTQQYKRKKLSKTAPRAREIRFVPTDLSVQPLGEVLASAGLERQRPVLYVWEGVSQYLTGAAVRATLRYVGGSAPGSAIVFTYVLRSALGAEAWADGGFRDLLGSSEPWLFGIEQEEVRGLLAQHGLNLVDDVGDREYQERYLDPIGRYLAVNQGERAALATVLQT